ncbi:O-antigen ligase family protein [Paenibacillus phoenicis]|uniref:O-antigen ligase family protein n=1 Tax=Paenibacillus phoenicis TaxID=554117 RepID=A0ABU5PMG1_9BACL|nr:O-antigen ligase family protein [Paenibacillus phoenicis]MEA3571071.1 O-antigen ligase family protein [Paenibacillus phoenicis]
MLLGGLLAVTALAVVYGLLPLPGAILRTADPAVSATGARLGGLLQYPNAFGAVMAAFLLERLMRLARMERAAFTRASSWRGQRAGALALLFALGLLLSESRGALAAALAGWAAGLALLRGTRRRRYAWHSAVFAGAAAVLARGLASAQLAPARGPGALALAAGLAAALLASGRVAGALPRLGAAGAPRPRAALRPPRRACACGAAALALLLAAPLAALPASAGFLGRGLRPETASARAAMYADAAELLRRSPWLGQGGDVWRHAFRRVQNLPYVGSEVHSGYLDLALDLGLLGLACALLWLGVMAIPLLRARSALLPPYLALLLHSAIDFDFSYGLVWMLLLWAAAIGIAEAGPARRLRLPALLHPGLVRGAYRRARRLLSPRPLRMVCSGLIAAALLLLSVSGLREAESQRLHRQALARPPEANREAAELLRRSLALAPYRTAVRLALAERSAPQEAASLLRAGLRYEPERAELWLALGRALAQAEHPAAAQALRQGIELNRYDRVKQTAALRELWELAQRLRASGQLQQAEAVASAGADLYARFLRLAGSVAANPALRNDRDFRLTEEAITLGRELQQQAHLYTGDATSIPQTPREKQRTTLRDQPPTAQPARR